MHLKMRSLLGLVALGASSAAFAQSSNWRGFYLGANAGYGVGKSDVSTSTVFSSTGYFPASSVASVNDKGADSVSLKGFTGGITVGYNFQNGVTVYGIEADANTYSVKGDRSLTVVYPGLAPKAYTMHQSTKADHLITLRGRMGYSAGRYLWYGTAGFAMTSVKIEDTFSDTFQNASENVSASKSKTGWVIGGGYEFSFHHTWSFKAEVLYLDFGKATVDGSVLTTDTVVVTTPPPIAKALGSSNGPNALPPPTQWPSSTFSHSATLKGEIIRFGVNYRF